MGIKGIHNIIKKYASDVYVEKHISEYAYKKVAIDISLYIFKYKAIFGEKWISSFITLICCLRKYDLHFIFIFDGVAPEEKSIERNARKESREKMVNKINQLETDLQHYKETGEVSELISEIYNKTENDKPLRLLGKASKKIDVNVIQNEIDKLKSYNIGITKKDIETVKEMFDIMEIPYVVADGEAECYASQLCLNGCVDMVLSEDTDVLVYGTPTFLTKINTSTGVVIEMKFEKLLECLELTHAQYVDLCILCGSDYNNTIRGVGPETAYKLMKEYGSIENIPEKYDTSVLNYERVRELFSKRKLGLKIPYCGSLDEEKMTKFLFENNIRIDMEYMKMCFSEANIIFED